MATLIIVFAIGALGGLVGGFFIGKKHGERAAAAVSKITSTVKEL